jgi:hypothetical protein
MADLTPETLMKCDTCGGGGGVPVGEHFVTHDMALDAGDPAMEGASMGIEWGPCPDCAERRAYAEAWKSQVASLTVRLDDEKQKVADLTNTRLSDFPVPYQVRTLERKVASLTERLEAAEHMDRVLLVRIDHKWYVRRVAVIEHDTVLDHKVYRCDTPLVNDAPTLSDALAALAAEEEKHGE